MECFTWIFDAYFLSSAARDDNEISLGSRGSELRILFPT